MTRVHHLWGRSLPNSRASLIWMSCWNQYAQAFSKSAEEDPGQPAEPIAIDAIRLKDSGVGARIVKLRGELAMCQTLFVGWVATTLVFVVLSGLQCFNLLPASGFNCGRVCVVFVLLLVVSAMIRLRRWYMEERHLRSLFNHWLLVVLHPIWEDKGAGDAEAAN